MKMTATQLRQIIKEEVARSMRRRNLREWGDDEPTEEVPAEDPEEEAKEERKRRNSQIASKVWAYTENPATTVGQLRQIIEDSVRFATGVENVSEYPTLMKQYPDWMPEDFKMMVIKIFEVFGLSETQAAAVFENLANPGEDS